MDGVSLPAELLALSNPFGWTVAHVLAFRGALSPESLSREVLLLATKKVRWTVAHELAVHGRLPRDLITSEVLLLATRHGWTVAHELAMHGHLPPSAGRPRAEGSCRPVELTSEKRKKSWGLGTRKHHGQGTRRPGVRRRRES